MQMTLLCYHQVLETLKNSTIDLSSLLAAAADVGLHVNATKTKVLILNHPWSPPLQVEDINLDFDDHFNYPGSFIAAAENDVKKLQGQAWDAFWRLECIWKSKLPIAIKVAFTSVPF